MSYQYDPVHRPECRVHCDVPLTGQAPINMHLKTEDIVGYHVCVDPISDVVNCVTQWIHERRRNCHYFACLNPHAAEIAAEDESFYNSLACADFLTADGIGVVYASRLLGGNIRKRVTGMDVFRGVTAAMNEAGEGSVFFLGSTEETLAAICREMAVQYPNVNIVGTWSPPFKPDFSDDDNSAMIEAINAAQPDVLWVGLTAPKQEKWVHAHQDELQVSFAGPIGAAFDFFVGNIKRVSPFWQDLGFEWLPRLIQEPRRLWRRSLVSAPRFLVRTLQYRRSRRR